jgi:hypothetical protein
MIRPRIRRTTRFLLFFVSALALYGVALFGKDVTATKTEHFDFPAGGVLKVDSPTGELTIEAWDQPGVELTTTTSATSQAELDKIEVKSERHGDELAITTTWPRDRLGFRLFDLEYVIRVPRSTKLSIHQTSGDVYIDGTTGDVDAHVGDGQITLHLPQDEKYAIDARCKKTGHVDSDFGGEEKHRWWRTSHYLEFAPAGAPHKLNLRVDFGDIVILKPNIPAKPQVP